MIVTEDRDEAEQHAVGHQVVIEEFLDGPEVSLFCLTDGETVVPLVPAQVLPALPVLAAVNGAEPLAV